MHDIPGQIADLLLEVKANLRSGGLWEPALALDTLRFELWLRWIISCPHESDPEAAAFAAPRSGIFVYARERPGKSHAASNKLSA